MLRRLLRRRRLGTSALEFGLTFPIFFLMVGGLIDSGWLFFQQSTLDSAIHLGCREGVLIDPGRGLVNITQAQNAARDAIRAALNLSNMDGDAAIVTVAVLYTPPNRSLQCTVSADYTPLLGMLPSMTLDARSVMRMEMQR